MKIFLYISILFIFLGCSSVDVDLPTENDINSTQESSQDFDDFDDFDDEMDIEKVYDPFIGYNRFMTGFNDLLIQNIFQPINHGYMYITHVEVRNSIGKFFSNIYYPMHLLNNLFQGKVDGALIETGRFMINSTVGILGLFDPAQSHFGLRPKKEDFGQTLGFYGVGAGPHIVIPVFGPSNLRDLISIIPDAAISPFDYTTRSWWTVTDTVEGFLAVKFIEKFNKMSLQSAQYDQVKHDSVDLYPYLRDIYEQKRIKDIEE